MAYVINKTDSSFLVTVADGAVDNTTTSVSLIGRGAVNYGELMAENLVHLLENFAYSSPPTSPLVGQLWYNTSEDAISVFNGTDWVAPVDTNYYSTVTNTTGTASITVNNDLGITVGAAAKLNVGYDTSSGKLEFTPFTDSPAQAAISIDPTSKLVTVFGDPVDDLGVATKRYVENWPNVVFDSNNRAAITNNSFLMTLGNVAVMAASSTAVNFSLTPNAPTVGFADNSTSLATTAFVQAQKISPALTGIPTAPTAPAGTNTNQLATTSFVRTAVNNGLASIDFSPYALKESPIFTGVPRADTAIDGTNTTQLATTEFVTRSVALRIGEIDFSPYARKESPTFTGVPRAPTANVTANTTQLATTAFVQAQKDSPVFTGSPRSTTPPAGDRTTRIATTAFVGDEIATIVGNIDFSPYAPKNSPKFTGLAEAPTPPFGSSTMQLATTEFVQNAVGAIDLSPYATKNSPTLTGIPTAPTASAGSRTAQLATTAFVQNEFDIFKETADLTLYAKKHSPILTGSPQAPTAPTSTNNTQLATTAFVQAQKDSPVFTGTPTAPTAAVGTNNGQIATTAFVNNAIAQSQLDRPFVLSMDTRGLGTPLSTSLVPTLNNLIPPARLLPGTQCHVRSTRQNISVTPVVTYRISYVTSVGISATVNNPTVVEKLVFQVNSNSTSWVYVSG